MLTRIPRPFLIAGGLLAAAILVAGWWAFRPELLFVNERVSEAPPEVRTASGNVATVLATGRFRSHAHDTEGTATIYDVDGQRVLRLTDFMTSNGPDVRVTLVAAEDARDDEAVKRAGYVSLGTMKGNVGDQNYEVPASLDLSKYRAVTIWCERFSVNFGTAPLQRG